MANLIIAANERRELTKAEEVLFVQNWTMGDNSSIVFAADVVGWKIIAKSFAFGANVVIDGSGTYGIPGQDAPTTRPPGVRDCRPGIDVNTGQPAPRGGAVFLST